MRFQIEALPADTFQDLFDMSDEERAGHNAQLVRIEEANSAPCRISLEDALPGEEVILAPYEHQSAHSPFRAAGPIFVRRGAAQAHPAAGEIPGALVRRLLSIRAYDRNHEMVDADVVEGEALEGLVGRFFERPETLYLHAHYARRGCYAARIVRV
jgi:hypothetical protein